MIKTISFSLLAALAFTACGDNIKAQNDASGSGGHDGSGSGGFPAAPTLGTQIDRMGRPAVNTALNHGFDGSAGVPSGSANMSKDAYNHDSSVGTWQQTWAPVFVRSLPILDALDTGVCGNGICETNGLAIETLATCAADCGGTTVRNGSDGCGNQAFFDGSAGQLGYLTLAGVLADDELYLETSKSLCAGYLAVEFYTQVLGLNVSNSCGGRAPSYDVIDTTYTLAAIGVGGFNPQTFAPAFGDTVAKHSDTDDAAFPFLGAPH